MVSKRTRIVSLVAASALVVGGLVLPSRMAHGDPAVVVPAGALELQDYDFKVRLHPDFPQVVDYRLGDEQLAGRVGPALNSVEVNGTPQLVSVASPVLAQDRMSATYALSFPNLAGVSLTIAAEVKEQTLRLTVTDLVDPNGAVESLRIPNHDLITLSSTDAAAQLTTSLVGSGTQAGADVIEQLGGASAGAVQGGWLTLAHDSSLAVGLATNAGDAEVNSRWQRQIRTADANRLGSVWAGPWTEIGNGSDPYLEVKVVADANGDGVINWQDAAIATRDILELGNGAEEVANEVIARVSLADPIDQIQVRTRAVSEATENLGQRVVLVDDQPSEDGVDMAALAAATDEGVAYNTTYGFYLPGAFVGGAQVEGLQEMWEMGPANADTLYLDEWLEAGPGRHAYEELQDLGWVVGSHPVSNPMSGSDVARFIYNGYRDGWEADPLLGSAVELGAEDEVNLSSVWQQNLPTKFLQRSELVAWSDTEARFADGTVATDGQINHDGAVVLVDGAYLLPWYDGGQEWNDEGPERLYHYNLEGGATSWQLTGEWRDNAPLTLFRLSEDGRAKVGEVVAVNGEISLIAEPDTAYVLFPADEAPDGVSEPPAAFTVEDVSAAEGESVSIDAGTTDPEGGPLAYSAVGLPAGVSLDEVTGQISGTPTTAGTYEVTVTAQDLAELTATATFTLTVTPATPGASPTPTPSTPEVSPTPSTPEVSPTPSTPEVSPTPSTPGVSPTPTPSTPGVSPKPTPTRPGVSPKPTPGPTTPTTRPTTPTVAPNVPKFVRTAPYTLAGVHRNVNGRDWKTECEPYSQTERCHTDIWATIVVIEDGQFVRKSGWAFNNLTYLPYMTEAAWQGNPLAMHNMSGFSSGGRQWRTECHTAQTGRGACRSYTMTTVYAATPQAAGGYTFSQSNQWVFNNIVMFGGPEQR